MDIILLPVLSSDTFPVDALKIMKESRRSVAVVVGSPPKGLITSLEVRKAKNKNQTDLKSVELKPLSVLFDGDFSANGYAKLKLPENSLAKVREHLLQTFPGMAHRQLNVPYIDLTAFENILPPGMMYGFLGYDRGAAVVITRHETLAAEGGAPPAACCCKNPDTPHEYEAGRKKQGEACDNCKYSVEC